MKFKLFFCSFILLVITVSCQAGLNRILQQKKLIVALPDDNYSIFIYKTKTQQLTGFDVELAKDIAKTLGVKIEFKDTHVTWNQLPQFIAEGKADMAIGSISISLNRAKYAAFTQPYAHLKLALFINRKWLAKHQTIEIEKALTQYHSSFGVMYGSNFIQYIKSHYPLARINYYHGLSQKMHALLNDQVNAIVTTDVTALNYLKQNPAIAFKYKLLILPTLNDDIGILVSYKNPDLLYWINLYLKTHQINYNGKQLLQHYFAYQNTNTHFNQN